MKNVLSEEYMHDASNLLQSLKCYRAEYKKSHVLNFIKEKGYYQAILTLNWTHAQARLWPCARGAFEQGPHFFYFFQLSLGS